MASTYTPGTYLAEVVAQGYHKPSLEDTLCFFLQFRTLGRYDQNGCVQPCPQHERPYIQYPCNGTVFEILKADLRSIGVRFGHFSDLRPDMPGHVSLVGREIVVECTVETNLGDQCEQWTLHRPRKKPARSDLRGLDDLLGHPLWRGNSPAKPNPGVIEPNDNDAAD
jgi:hypothetical protein